MSAAKTWVSDACLLWLVELLRERFGVVFSLIRQEAFIVISCAPFPGHVRIRINPSFAGRELDGCAHWEALAEGWQLPLGSTLPAPGLGQIQGALICETHNGYDIDYDLLGLTYWMLSRREEVDATQQDEIDRFPAHASHAQRHGYLQRPIVDEWLLVLREVFSRLWPDLSLAQPSFAMRVSHDVDVPSVYGFASLPRLLRHAAANLLKRRDWRGALMAPWIRMRTRNELLRNDPMNTFDWLMDLSDQHGLVSAFYFICGRTDALRDADYEPEHPAIRALLRHIHQRGHEVGLHPSFNSYLQPRQIAFEAQRLRQVCAQEGVHQDAWGGRMHYLRWRQPITLQAWQEAAMAYDSTLGYAEAPGFRCGTCFEYPAFDPVAEQMLDVRIRPLVAMEISVMASQYLGLGTGTAALECFLELKRACRAVGGVFTLLWHNSNLCTAGERNLYAAVLEQN